MMSQDEKNHINIPPVNVDKSNKILIIEGHDINENSHSNVGGNS